MTSAPVASAKQSVRRSAAPLWLVALAKAGYGARGFVYLTIGTLALLKAFGRGGGNQGSKGALAQLLEAPGGQVLLWLLAVGLVGYAVWRLCQAVLDADHHGKDAKGIVIRLGLLVSAITHLGLAYYAGWFAWQQAGGGGGGGSGVTAEVMRWPGGPVLIAAVGVAIIGAGVAHAIKAHKEKYEEHFVLDPATMKKLEPICKFGLYARSVTFAIIGGMFIYAAITQDPDDAGGLQKVLDQTAQQPFGMVLLGVMAAGLFAFGLYSCFLAAYRRINDPWQAANKA